MINHLGPSGFLVIDKPSGITSFDVIRELRRLLKIKKLGHSGVLDKPATGVLVIGANRATRLFELFNGFEKEYIADLWFGISTTTDDLTGELVETGEGEQPGREAVEQALSYYRGTIDQVPPAFSLTKKGGKELYRYALAGEKVEVEPKRVTILDSQILEFEPNADPRDSVAPDGKLAGVLDGLPPLTRVRVKIRCVGGVYVRCVARDVGADLGVKGTLGNLARTRVGPFYREDALELDDIARMLENDTDVAGMFLPLASISPDESRLLLDPKQLSMVRNGQSIRRFKQHLPPGAVKRGDIVYGMDPGHDLAVILKVAGVNQHGLVELKPSKVLT